MYPVLATGGFPVVAGGPRIFGRSVAVGMAFDIATEHIAADCPDLHTLGHSAAGSAVLEQVCMRGVALAQ